MTSLGSAILRWLLDLHRPEHRHESALERAILVHRAHVAAAHRQPIAALARGTKVGKGQPRTSRRHRAVRIAQTLSPAGPLNLDLIWPTSACKNDGYGLLGAGSHIARRGAALEEKGRGGDDGCAAAAEEDGHGRVQPLALHPHHRAAAARPAVHRQVEEQRLACVCAFGRSERGYHLVGRRFAASRHRGWRAGEDVNVDMGGRGRRGCRLPETGRRRAAALGETGWQRLSRVRSRLRVHLHARVHSLVHSGFRSGGVGSGWRRARGHVRIPRRRGAARAEPRALPNETGQAVAVPTIALRPLRVTTAVADAFAALARSSAASATNAARGPKVAMVKSYAGNGLRFGADSRLHVSVGGRTLGCLGERL
mmetsp:Transcript_41795/g.87480  ORF Transcript_41795/g.87480 Transcript_41795/m.87480 type:complete len:368 (-) Transcript_41795:465-1568(-)